MMETRGRIVAVADGLAEVQIAAVSACGSCRSKSLCGTAAGDGRVLRVAATAAMRPGDEVTLQVAAGTVASGALLGYLMPALAVLAGAVAGAQLFGSDAAAAAGAGIGLALGLAALRLSSRLILRERLHPAACRSAPDSFTGTGDRP